MPVAQKRQKTPKVVITFASTGDAMAAEDAARTYGLPGRMIPVPSEISAGCGLSWAAAVADEEALLAGVAEHGVAHEGVFHVDLY